MASATLVHPVTYRPAFYRWPILLRACLPAILFAGMLALESTAIFGSDHTSGPLHGLVHPILGSSADHNWTLIHHLIRKTGHFAGYGFFSLLCWRGLMRTPGHLLERLSNPGTYHRWAIAATLIIASADEIHQSFLPNRTGSFYDVLLDCAGAFAMQTAILAVRRVSHTLLRQALDPESCSSHAAAGLQT